MASRRGRSASSDTEPLLSPVSTERPTMSGSQDAPGTAAPAAGSLRNQVLAGVFVTFGGLVAGMTLGYSSTAGVKLQNSTLHTTDSEDSLIGSMMPLGALFGGLVAGWAVEALGRRSTMVLITVPGLLGWLLITYATSVGTIIAGRVFTGFAAGCTSLVAPTYVGEVTEARIRGTMGASFQFQVTLGVLLSYVIGKYADWNYLAMASAFFPVVWLVLVCFIRESPVWLVDKNRELEAHDALLWLRGTGADVNAELAQLRRQNEEIRAKQASFRNLKQRENLRPLIMSLMLMLLQQLSGINAVIFYTTDIFKDAGSSIDPNLATIIVGLVQCLSTFAGVVLVDRLGRKVLLILSDVIMGVCLLALGIYFYLSSHDNADNLGWLPLASLMIYIFAFSVGFGPIPWLMMGELFAPEVKGIASGVATFFNWTLAFLVTLTFKPLVNGMTEAGVFWMFTAICLLGAVGVFFFTYETKGRTLEEIQDHFRQ
ncbi:facilitated trehalose transporter Tret1-like [Pollicipes pollicipes]|uniref:facilitated trehalose transporter Tret1-like n=1 Tax=Pollicipes pollicipes TaxID=41117 RepID=UPI00188577DA|nr:facilitated trehalose transporter Tret1-like [Pollicipes pollicipes]